MLVHVLKGFILGLITCMYCINVLRIYIIVCILILNLPTCSFKRLIFHYLFYLSYIYQFVKQSVFIYVGHG